MVVQTAPNRDLKQISAAYSLYSHQEAGVAALRRIGGRAGLFMDTRTGKTRTALAYLDEEEAHRILCIIWPLSVISVWEREIKSIPIGERLPVLVLDDSLPVAKRAERLKAFGDGIVLVNYEAYWREPLRSAIVKWGPEAVIADEAQRLQHRSSRQSKFAHYLAELPTTRYHLALTGTPITKGIQNLFSIYRFIDHHIFGRKWWDFQNRYLIMGGFENHQILGYRNQHEAEELVALTSYRVLRDECFDLPPRQDIVVPVPLGPKSIAAYEDMRKRYVAELDGTDDEGRPLSGLAVARIVLVATLRLQQIAGGTCTLDNGASIDVGDEKLQACLDQVQSLVENGENVVVFCRFRREIARIVEGLKALKLGTQVLIGGMSRTERNKVIEGGKWLAHVPVLVSQIKVGSVGISLAAASSAIFYSTGFALDDFIQARDRLHGADQTRKVGYYHMLATVNGRESIDHKVYKILDKRQNLAQTILHDRILAKAILS